MAGWLKRRPDSESSLIDMEVRRATRILRYGLRLKCPNCGLGSLYRSPFKMETQCRYCDLIYEREQGYFIGAIYINVIVTETSLLLTLLLYGLLTGSFTERILFALLVLAIIVPLLFYHHSKSLWLAFDHILNPEKHPSMEV